MSRVLKFRSWSGYYFSYLDLRTDNDVDFYLFYRDIDIDSPIEQYTGLKNKNGEEIYEGDIISYSELKFVVVWSEFDSSFKMKCDELDVAIYLYSKLAKEVKILGNIHEDPELLGEKNEL